MAEKPSSPNHGVWGQKRAAEKSSLSISGYAIEYAESLFFTFYYSSFFNSVTVSQRILDDLGPSVVSSVID
jgi:hypothetical protein